MTRYKNILFDLDGTLTDPYAGIANSVKYALGKFNISENDETRLKLFIGPPLEQSFAEFYQFSSVQSKAAVKYYREYFTKNGIYENKLYPGIENVLKSVTENNQTAVLATSKPQIFAADILRYFGIAKYFEDIIGSNLDGTLSEKEEIIKYAIEKNHLNKEESVMIGDRKYDITGAHKNNIHSIAVLYGYGSHEELEKAKPTYFCQNVSGILKII
ncbi:MAG: HAD hydrolase-like protein [Planctomycetaceae bacterium]|jgi:phosphoglycolate phosphatase|nr:HAD hydrolase-like protein [Planctomycetaceae bacterium]